MGPFKKSSHTLVHEKELRNLIEAPGVAYKYPIYKALDNWLRKINGAMETPEDIIEKNNQIFFAFVFLVEHDYLFYLTITRQVLVIKALFEKNGIHLRREGQDLLIRIKEAYEQAVQNKILFELHTSFSSQSSLSNDEPYPMAMPNCSVFELYCHLREEYEHLNHHYEKEQNQLIQDIYDEHLDTFLEDFQNDPQISDELKEELGPILRGRVNDAMSEFLEGEEERSIPFSFEGNSLSEAQDPDSLPEYAPGLDESEPITHKPVHSTHEALQSSFKTRTSPQNTSVKVATFIGRLETMSSTFVDPDTKQLKHPSLKTRFELCQRVFLRASAAVEILDRIYQPTLEHVGERLGQAQKIALDKLNLDLNAFMNILIKANPKSAGDKVQIDDAIKRLSPLVRTLNDRNDVQFIKKMVREYLRELDSMNYLFAQNGPLNGFIKQYRDLIQTLNKQEDIKQATNPLCSIDAKQSPAAMFNKYAARRAVWANRFFKSSERSMGEEIGLNDEIIIELKNMIEVIGVAFQSSSQKHPNHQPAKELLATIRLNLSAQKAAIPANLTSLAALLEELLPGALVYGSGLLEMAQRIRNLPKENTLKH